MLLNLPSDSIGSYNSYHDGMYVWGYILGCLIISVICGAITRKINQNKGYDGGFAWGFFLWIIGIIVVACRADNSKPKVQISQSPFYDQTAAQRIINNGGWTCKKCGSKNQDDMEACTCGMTKQENEVYHTISENDKNEFINIQKLKSYKELLDMGAISQEEFDEKKRELLNQ